MEIMSEKILYEITLDYEDGCYLFGPSICPYSNSHIYVGSKLCTKCEHFEYKTIIDNVNFVICNYEDIVKITNDNSPLSIIDSYGIDIINKDSLRYKLAIIIKNIRNEWRL